MDKKIIILTLISVVVIIGVALYLTGDFVPQIGKTYENIVLDQDLTALDLTQEELDALEQEGIELAPTQDVSSDALLLVQTSDELSSIQSDLENTDLSDLTAELDQINSDLSGI